MNEIFWLKQKSASLKDITKGDRILIRVARNEKKHAESNEENSEISS